VEECTSTGFASIRHRARARRRGFNERSEFFSAVRGPALAYVKLIAEPWDVGMADTNGPVSSGWAEWNDRCRDTIRGFWRREEAASASWPKIRRLERSVSSRRPQTQRRRQFRHRARRLHAARSGVYNERHNLANAKTTRTVITST